MFFILLYFIFYLAHILLLIIFVSVCIDQSFSMLLFLFYLTFYLLNFSAIIIIFHMFDQINVALVSRRDVSVCVCQDGADLSDVGGGSGHQYGLDQVG